jgi:hypothetical protein
MYSVEGAPCAMQALCSRALLAWIEPSESLALPGQFFWTRQLPPAAFSLVHKSLASSADANGPTMVR